MDEPLPYAIVINPRGVWYGPLGTTPFSRDWQRYPGHVEEFISICCRSSFAMSPDDTWRITATEGM